MEGESVSHEDLSAAQDAAIEEVANEEPEDSTIEEEPEVESQDDEVPDTEEEPPAEPGNNQERSNLGRKVQGVDEKLNLLMYQIEQLQNAKASPPETPEPKAEGDDDVDIITNKDLPKHIAKYERQKAAKRTAYEKDMMNRIGRLGATVEDDDWQGITQIIQEKFRPVTGNSANDAVIIFNEAKAQYYENKIRKKSNPLDKNKGVEAKNLGGPSGTSTAPKGSLKTPKQKEAIELAKALGMTPEQVDKALRRE